MKGWQSSQVIVRIRHSLQEPCRRFQQASHEKEQKKKNVECAHVCMHMCARGVCASTWCCACTCVCRSVCYALHVCAQVLACMHGTCTHVWVCMVHRVLCVCACVHVCTCAVVYAWRIHVCMRVLCVSMCRSVPAVTVVSQTPVQVQSVQLGVDGGQTHTAADPCPLPGLPRARLSHRAPRPSCQGHTANTFLTEFNNMVL